jgi:hypothetical protein
MWHVWEESRDTYRVLVGETFGKESTWKDVGVSGGLILKWVFKKWYGRICTG